MSVAKLSEVLGKSLSSATSTGCAAVEVLTTTANGKQELPVSQGKASEIDGVKVTYFRRLTKDHSHFSPALLLALYKKLSKSPASESQSVIVHIHAWWNLVSVLACVIALAKKKPVILSPRGTLSNYSFNNRASVAKKIFHRLIGESLLSRCHFHVTSEKEKMDLLQLLSPKDVTVIPNFVQLPNKQTRFQPDRPPVSEDRYRPGSPRPLRLIFLSRIEEKKGLDILLTALTRTQVPWTLSIAGDGEPEYISSLKLMISKLSVQKPYLEANIRWIGPQGPNEKFDVLADHDLLVLPSHDENFGNVVIESLAVGTRVLISKNVGLADYVERNGLGLICTQSPQSVASNIDQAYANHQKAGETSVSAQDVIRNDFSETTLLDQYRSLYLSIASND